MEILLPPTWSHYYLPLGPSAFTSISSSFNSFCACSNPMKRKRNSPLNHDLLPFLWEGATAQLTFCHLGMVADLLKWNNPQTTIWYFTMHFQRMKLRDSNWKRKEAISRSLFCVLFLCVLDKRVCWSGKYYLLLLVIGVFRATYASRHGPLLSFIKPPSWCWGLDPTPE